MHCAACSTDPLVETRNGGMRTTSTRTQRWRASVVAAASALAIGLVGVAGWAWYAATLAESFSKARVPRLDRASARVAPGLYMIGKLGPSAAYVVATSEGLMLIDSGLAQDAAVLKSEMASLGLDWKRVRAILLTHVHGDHSGGAQALRQATGARVYAGKGDVPVLLAGGPREAFYSTFYMPDHPPHATQVDVALEGGETIALGDVRVRAIGAPGHTPGSMCYAMERKGYRAFFAGDVIMMLRGDDQPAHRAGQAAGHLLGLSVAPLSRQRQGLSRDSRNSAPDAGSRPFAAGASRRGRDPAEPLPDAGAVAVAAR